MLLGRVIGTVWATRKDEKLGGLKLQIVGQIGLDAKPVDAVIMAIVDSFELGGKIVYQKDQDRW
jgi:microcompartment protein CcmK/EutM